MEKIILASGSPRRRQLLEWAEVGFEVFVKATPETYPPGLPATEVPVHIARNKALAVRGEAAAGRVILAADTIVVLGAEIIGKPAAPEGAVNSLAELCR